MAQEWFKRMRDSNVTTEHPQILESLRFSNALCARHAVEDGEYKKTIQALSSARVAHATDDTDASKAPSSWSSLLFPDTRHPLLSRTRKMDVRALRSFPSGIALGPANFSLQGLLEVVYTYRRNSVVVCWSCPHLL